MLPITTLQFSEFATFETELNGPNLLPEDATEPAVGFAELLGLTAGPLPEATLPAGLDLPEGGNLLPASPTAGPLPTVLPVTAEMAPATDTALPGTPGRDLPLQFEAGAGPRTPVAALPTMTGAPATTGQPTSQPPGLPLADLPVAGSTTAPGSSQAATPPGISAIDVARATPRPVKEINIAPTKIAPVMRAPVATSSTTAPQQPLPVVPTAEMQAAIEPGRDSQRLRQALQTTQPLAAADSPSRSTDLPATELPQASRPLPNLAAAAPAQVQPLTPVAMNLESAEMSLVQAATTTAVSSASGRPAAEIPAPTGMLAERIDVPVRDAAWSEQLGQRLQLMASNRLQTAEIRLTPAELGPLRIQVALEDGAANVTFQAQHAVTREAIEQALPRLREMLAENGVQLNQTDVGDQGVRQGDRQAGEETRGTARGEADLVAEAEVDETGIGTARQRDPDGLVDTFV